MQRLSTLTDRQSADAAVDDCMRYLSCLTSTRGAHGAAMERFLQRWPKAVYAPLVQTNLEDYRTKAAVPPESTSGPLASKPFIDPILAIVQRESLLGRVQGFRPVPFLAPVPIQISGGKIKWVGQGTPKPSSKSPFSNPILAPTKLAGIRVLTDELAQLSQGGAERAIADILTAEIVLFQDQQMLDPAVAEVVNLNPASLTNGVTPTPATGDMAKDVAALLAALFTARPGAARPTLIMSPANASALAATGAAPQLNAISGGLALGVPVYPSPGAGQHVVAVDAAAVVYADGGLMLDVSDTAAIQMDDAPDNPATAATVLTDLWGNNLTGIKADRIVNWKAAPNSVQYFTVAA